MMLDNSKRIANNTNNSQKWNASFGLSALNVSCQIDIWLHDLLRLLRWKHDDSVEQRHRNHTIQIKHAHLKLLCLKTAYNTCNANQPSTNIMFKMSNIKIQISKWMVALDSEHTQKHTANHLLPKNWYKCMECLQAPNQNKNKKTTRNNKLNKRIDNISKLRWMATTRMWTTIERKTYREMVRSIKTARERQGKNGPCNLINTNGIIHMLAHKLFGWILGMA